VGSLASTVMLTVIEARVLGCLLEKERTTPDQYPLSLNALVLACNQSTARDPVMTVDPHDAEAAVMSMKTQGLVRLVHPSHGKSVTRFRQVADEHFGWNGARAAVFAVLLLRGPQTTAEIRTRTERLHDFGSVEAVEAMLREMADAEEPSIELMQRSPGQKEVRWRQLIADEAVVAPRALAPAPAGGLAERVATLEARVATLEAALADLL
jgi:uncharacterized protein YceH (UPF0502 family)